MFNQSSVLITGGTGSFGQAYTRTLLERYDAKRIVIFSRDELKQAEMQQKFPQAHIEFVIGDVRDLQSVRDVMCDIDYVIHAAAMKHVPAAEQNPMECIKTNIHGSENVIRAAIEAHVKKAMLLSSDKAATPINLYGATKLAADKLFIAANNLVQNNSTRFAVTRYGNVVNTRGSVYPLFKKLLAQGATALPITDPRMTRFWITVEQGVDFVLKNFERMQGGEIFMPKLPSVKIVDLIKSMGDAIDMEVIGIRPGEKIHEMMCPTDDAHLTLEFADHFIIQPSAVFSSDVDYSNNAIGEQGQTVAADFEYSSVNNPHFLSVAEITQMNKQF